MSRLIETPFKDLNQRLGGGLRTGRTVFIADESFKANTMLALNIVHHITRVQRLPVIWFICGDYYGDDFPAASEVERYRSILHGMDLKHSLLSNEPARIIFHCLPSREDASFLNTITDITGRRKIISGKEDAEPLAAVVVSNAQAIPGSTTVFHNHDRVSAFLRDNGLLGLLIGCGEDPNTIGRRPYYESYTLNLTRDDGSRTKQKLEVFQSAGGEGTKFRCAFDEQSKIFSICDEVGKAPIHIPADALRRVGF